MRKNGIPIARCIAAHAYFTAVAVDLVNLPLSTRNRIKFINAISIISIPISI
ncbi:MAG: hypothetical protein WBB37_06980 [bacterium]